MKPDKWNKDRRFAVVKELKLEEDRKQLNLLKGFESLGSFTHHTISGFGPNFSEFFCCLLSFLQTFCTLFCLWPINLQTREKDEIQSEDKEVAHI